MKKALILLLFSAVSGHAEGGNPLSRPAANANLARNWARNLAGGNLPVGDMPVVDGVWSKGEWDNARVISFPRGEARLRVAGRALCLGIRMKGAYAGERIDLYVAEKDGSSYCVHHLHPACHLPRAPFSPMPAVVARRGDWAERGESALSAAYSTRFAAKVLQKDEEEWTAEFVVGADALDLSADRIAGFRIEVIVPFSDRDQMVKEGPAEWETLNARWVDGAKIFSTPQEDKRSRLHVELLRESIARMSSEGKTTVEGPMTLALDRTFDRERVDKLIAACDEKSFFGLLSRALLFRRSNRIDAGQKAFDQLIVQFPRAAQLAPVRAERTQLLLAEGKFEPIPKDALWMEKVLAAWTQEAALRKRDAKQGGLPLAEFKTSRGTIVVELYAHDSPELTEALQKWIRDGKLKDVRCSAATGGLGAAFPVPTTGDDIKASGRRAWRGTLALVQDKDATAKDKKLRLLFATGQVHLFRRAAAIGRIVRGQEFVDALGVSDTILSARMP